MNDPQTYRDTAPDLPAVGVLLDQAAHHLTELIAGLAQIAHAIGDGTTPPGAARTEDVLRNIDQAIGPPAPPDTLP